MGRVVPELARVGARAQQRVQSTGRSHAGDQRVQVEAAAFWYLILQTGECVVDGLLEPRRRLACGRSQGHAQRAALLVQCQQQCQQTCSGVGLARARPTGDDRQTRTQRHGTGHFLPVGVYNLSAGRKKAVQPAACRRLGHGQRFAGPLQQALAHTLFIARITAQVQERCISAAAQHQRLALVGRVAVAHAGLGGCRPLQSRLPVGQRSGQVRPQGSQALRPVHRHGGPAQQGHRGRAQVGQRQAGVAPPFHLRKHGRRHQQRRAGLRIEPQQLGCKRAVDVAQQALLGPQLQPLQRLRSAQALGGQVVEPVHLGDGNRHRAGGLFETHAFTSALSMASRPSSNSIGAGKVQQPPAGPSMPRKNRYTAPPSCCTGS